MNRLRARIFECLRSALIVVAVIIGAIAQTPAPPPLSPNDISWLFPPPTTVSDLDKLVALRDLTTQNPQDSAKRDRVWTDAVFQQFIAIATGPHAQVAGTQSRIELPADAKQIDAWFVAGIRIDAGAPGLSPDVQAQFGQSPEIRLIVQPVTRNADGTVTVNDIAGHLIFDFVVGQDAPAGVGCFPRPKPDLVTFKAIVEELAALRTKLNNGQFGAKVATAGVPLGVHPGLVNLTTANNVRTEMIGLLERHLSSARLNAMAITGVPAGSAAPWIFLSMLNAPPGAIPGLPDGGFVPVHGPALDGQQFAEMLAPVGSVPGVVPDPQANNLNPSTCKNAAVSEGSLPVTTRKGSSTSTLFVEPPPATAATQQILAVIADPAKSHFFNTDCVSCHTETRRAMALLQTKSFEGIDSTVLPPGDWTVRNFGWSSPIDGPIQGVVTRRASAETDAVVKFINSQILNK